MTGWMLAIDFLVIGFIGGLLSLDRRAAFQFMVSQPIIAVTIVGAYFGDIESAVLIGSLLQLMWMSCVMFGANVPHNDTLAAVIIASGAYLYGVDPNHVLDEATWMIAILAGAPMCLLGQWLDVRLDHMNLALAEQADRAAAEGRTYIISFMVFRALTQSFLINAIVTVIASAVLFLLMLQLRPLMSPVVVDAMAIIAIYVVPAVGLAVALSLLRHRRAIVLAIGIFVAASAVITQGLSP